MKLQFLWYENNHQDVWNWIVLVWNRIPKVWKIGGMKIYSKVWKWCRTVWKNTKGLKWKLKVWKRCPRYEMETQEMKQPHKVIKCVVRYEKCVFSYEIEFSWKNSGFSFLCGSISYLFGYEKNRCFFLMIMSTTFWKYVKSFDLPLKYTLESQNLYRPIWIDSSQTIWTLKVLYQK